MAGTSYGDRLGRKHPTSLLLLDETGAISNDRFFAVGLVKATNPSTLLRTVQKFRDRKHYYTEFKFSDVTRSSLPMYKDLASEAVGCGDLSFRCFLADRQAADPVVRFGDQWQAYLKMAEQLVLGALVFNEVASVLADNYSTPDHVRFEDDLRDRVNRRTSRLALTSVVRLDSKSSDGLQIVDMLTSAAAFEFRAAAGLASHTSPKGQLAEHVRTQLGVTTLIGGLHSGPHSLKIYTHGGWTPPSPNGSPATAAADALESKPMSTTSLTKGLFSGNE
ncbi:DUF3800 domain-containing protein [Microbacterium flavescens]|uniref:DUF3800 domain-containing protein n=1 Tax=Microbacterium flavescens TaxID=69366 RepID=UPI001BDE327C|nr:DUF3800 domain-containing protein [Microbacterium flavescens]BFF12276.1 hypothetical protein GCM10025699_35790 [Microbacterium flavescens]